MLEGFSESLGNLKNNLKYCQKCFNISEDTLCEICASQSRQQKIICVVEEPLDAIAIEKTKRFNGLYHVLGGVITSFQENNQLKISELEKRISDENIEEVIIATNPTTEGDATALYLAKNLRKYSIKITRLARGLSTGGDLEYADEITLGSALNNRTAL